MPVKRVFKNPTEGFSDAEKLAWNKAIDFVNRRLGGYSDVQEDGNSGNYINVIKIEDLDTFMNELKVK
jgi:hypothetical protein